MIQKFHFLLLI